MHPLLPGNLGRAARTALRIGDDRLSYHDLLRAAEASAARLLADSLRPGDRVAVWATPSAATAAAIVGNAVAGLVTVPLNPALGERELAHILADAAPKRILADHPEAFEGRIPDGGPRIEAIVTAGPRRASFAEVGPDAPLLVLYTSGTTGAPKGAILTHGNAASNLDGLAAAWAWSGADTLVHALPLFHVHGLVLGLFGSLRAGSELLLLPRFSPQAVCEAFGPGGGSMLFAVPTMYHRLAEHLEAHAADRTRLAAARLLVSGSAALPVREHERLAGLLGQRIVERYGLTETLINCAIRHDGERRPGTVGPPVDGVELKLVDDDRRPLPDGDETAIGEVAVRGPNVFAGYLNRPDATAAVVDEDGFFLTGDLATRSADGYVRIVGRRATDLIKTGGYKVGAGEVEAALLEHPGVREAAVIGSPDDDLGERIVAFVVPAPGEPPSPEELSSHVASLLAPHKRPRQVEIVPDLPRNAMGKVLKKQLGARSTT
ncbi:AMP-binding protein [Vulgatibacter incomptus]|uniref:Putative fatty acid synthase n=1 Tax=Vulgatibacter incomptus TaxID=1391653 RepID=A0A0K1PAC2_9BACT|nr:AMP-binding protein [Vulgatibacter incomptus]AKU90465.1 putative fatty acid synthase [Vulgatibacter incomptus]